MCVPVSADDTGGALEKGVDAGIIRFRSLSETDKGGCIDGAGGGTWEGGVPFLSVYATKAEGTIKCRYQALDNVINRIDSKIPKTLKQLEISKNCTD